MKLAFLGPANSFDFHQIGGTNSFIRRVSQELLTRDICSVDYFLYGTQRREIIHTNRFHSRYFSRFNDAIRELEDFDQIVTVYTPIKNLVQFKKFCSEQKRKTAVHVMYWDWPESFFIRNLKIFTYTSIPYNGFSIAVSPRLHSLVGKRRKNSILLMPPVPSDYFISPPDKSVRDTIRVSFIGRIDRGKGIQATLEIFNKLSDYPEIELAFYGTFWENDPVAKRIHQQLSQQDSFRYIPVNFHEFSDEIEHLVRDAFRETDIFIQPYKKLSSTIDMPVLVLEAMASLSALITTPVGDIPSIYPKSRCIIPHEHLVNDAIQLITSGREWLPEEHDKIWKQNELLHFDTPSIVDHLIQTMKK